MIASLIDSEALQIAALTALANGAVTWGVMKMQFRLLRHQINAAHRRLDKLGAPPAGMDAIPE